MAHLRTIQQWKAVVCYVMPSKIGTIALNAYYTRYYRVDFRSGRAHIGRDI